MQLLFFHGTFCPPCESTKNAAEQFAEQSGIDLYTFRCEDVYVGHEMAKQNHVRHIPCLILKDDAGKELVRTEAAHTLETLHKAFDPFLNGGETNE